MIQVTNTPITNPYETELAPTDHNNREPVCKESTKKLVFMLIVLSQQMDKEASNGTCPHHNQEAFPNPNTDNFPSNNGPFQYNNGLSPLSDGFFGINNDMLPSNNGLSPSNNGLSPSNNGPFQYNNGLSPLSDGFLGINNDSLPSNNGLSPLSNGDGPFQSNNGLSPSNNELPKDFREKEVAFDTSKMDMYTLIMLLQEERVGLLESQIQDQSTRMKGINNEIKQIGNTIGKVNELSSSLKEGDDKTVIDPGLRKELTDMGIDVPEGEVSKDQLNAFAENLKSKRDGLNNDSQMEMIRLQGLINKQQQAYQLITNIQKKEHDMMMSTINKIN